MPHSYCSCLIHYTFSTKGRERNISADLLARLCPYMGGIARENNMRALSVGGTHDHVHLLVSLPSPIAVAKGVQLIKGGSSKWIHETFPDLRDFAWQEGYGAFSIAISGVADTTAYINNQQEHHRTRTFQEEFIAFLRRHGIQYDERYIWD